MNKPLAFTVALLFHAVGSFSQVPDTLWTRSLQQDFRVRGITSHGQFIHLAGDDRFDIHLARYRTNGTFDLSISAGTEWGSTIAGIVSLNNGAPYLVGTIERDALPDQMLLGFMSSQGIGLQIDLSQYGAYRGDQLKRNAAGEIFAVGKCRTDTIRSLLVKLDSNADTLWTYTSTEPFGLPFGDISPTHDGGCFLCDPADELRLRKISAAGLLEWDSLYTDLPASSWTMRIAEIDGGDHVVAYAAEHPPYPQVFVRITPAGEIVDVRLHSIGDVPFPVASQALISRGTLLVSISNTINGNPVMLLNSELDILWTYSPRMHGIPVDDISAAAFTADGNLVLATSYHPAAGHLILLGTALSAEPPSTHMPYELHLAAYPNPFNARTTLLLTMPTAGDTRVCLVDMLGRIALDQSLGTLSPGEHPVEINAANLPTGIYVVNVQSGSFTATQKLLLLK